MDPKTKKILEQARTKLEEAGVGIIELNEEFEALILGDLEGVEEYVGVRLEVEDGEILVVIEILIEAEGLEDKEAAVEYFTGKFGNLLAEDQEEIDLELDEEEGYWVTEMAAGVEDESQMVEAVVSTLEELERLRVEDEEMLEESESDE